MQSRLARERLDAAVALSKPCQLCPRRCGVDRLAGEVGACGAGPVPRLVLEYVHWAEDADIVPAQTLYLDGCNLTCSFCQTRHERGTLSSTALTPAVFQRILARGFAAGAKTVDILGGEPGVHLPGLLRLFAAGDDFPGLVWNSNLYATREAVALLDGVVDTYLADVKFGSSACAAALAGVPDATEVAWRRIGEIYAKTPEALIVRHLVVPGHFVCCTRPVLERIARELPGVRVSVKTVFLPPVDMPPSPERRYNSPPEIAQVEDLTAALGLRRTRDADITAAAAAASAGASAGGQFEVVVTPEGGIYLRHVVREAAQLMDALRFPVGDAAGAGPSLP